MDPFILDTDTSSAPITSTIACTVEFISPHNTIPIYTVSNEKPKLISSQGAGTSLVNPTVSENFPKGVVVQETLINKDLHEFRIAENEMPSYFLKFFDKAYNIPDMHYNGALVPEHIQMFFKPIFRSVSDTQSLIKPFRIKSSNVRPLMSDYSFSVWINHVNSNLRIENIPDQVFYMKKPFKSRVYTSFKLVRETIRSMLLLSPAISNVLLNQNSTDTTYFLNDTYFESMKYLCMTYVFLLNQLRHLCFPKGSTYNNLRYICNKPMIADSLWNINAEEKKALRAVALKNQFKFNQRPRFPARRGQWQGRRRFGRKGLRNVYRGGFNSPSVSTSKASIDINSTLYVLDYDLKFLYNDVDIIDCQKSKLSLSINENSDRWQILQNEFVMNLVKEGLKIFVKNERTKIVESMFRTVPKESFLSGEQFRIAKEQVEEFLKLNVIEEIPNGSYIYSSIFVVVDESRSTKHRLIFNMKNLNKNLAIKSFSMINQKDVVEMVREFSYAGVVDISKAYFHLSINKEFQKYFVFAFDKKIYSFLVMPFGLCTAPYLFTKFTSPIWEFLRSKFNIPIISYIDDILILGKTYSECQKFLNITINLLIWLGFRINPKSSLTPQQSFVYLGMQFNLQNQTVANTEKNINKCISQCLHISNSEFCTLKDIQSLLGRINFCQHFIPNSRIYRHDIIRFLNNNFSLRTERIVNVTKELVAAVVPWTRQDFYIPISLTHNIPIVTVHTDASIHQWGAHIQLESSLETISESWNSEDMTLNINDKELKAVFLTIQVFAEKLRNTKIKIFCDNKTAVSTLQKSGSHTSTFRHKILIQILEIVTSINSIIEAYHIKGRSNVLADSLSRKPHLMPSELELSSELFLRTCIQFSVTPEIDLFATKYSKKLQTYSSSIPDGQAYRLDAFSFNWERFQCLYAFPPPNLISKILFKWKNTSPRGKLLLIAPSWPTQVWYGTLLQMAKRHLPLHIQDQDLFVRTKKELVSVSHGKLHLTGYLL